MLKPLLFFSVVAVAVLLNACSPGSQSEESEEVKDPLNGYTFLWDFTLPREIKYEYEMTSITSESFGRNDESYMIKKMTTGDFIVKSSGDQKADVSIVNAEEVLFSLSEDGSWSPAKPMPVNRLEIGSLKQYSRFEDPRLDAVWDAFLPLPLEELDVNESYELKMRLPVSMEGGKYVHGKNSLTFAGYETILGTKCIKLKGEIDVSDIDPLEFGGTYEHSLEGEGTYYFSADDHMFVQVNAEIILKRLVDSGEVADAKNDLYMKSEITDAFKITLKK